MNKTKLVLTAAIIFSCTISMAQTRTVSGKITSSEDSKPIPEVSVRLKGAIASTVSDAKGGYSIAIDENSTEVLIFSHPDFDDMEIGVNGKNQLDIQLTSNVRYNQYGVRVNRTPLDAEERNGILVFESKDQSHRVWYDVRVQADGAMFFGDTYNEIGNGTSIRRARFAVKTEFANNWYAEFDMDIANSELELKDAYLQYQNNGLEVRVGNFKEVYSMESTTTSRYLTFLERPMAVNTFAPSRHIGFGINYNREWLFTSGGIHFQAVDDLEERTFSKDHNKDGGIDEGYSLTGKLVIMPWFSDVNKGLHIGIAGSYRTPRTDAEVWDYATQRGSIRYSTRSLSSINRKKYIDTDDITNVEYSTLGGMELAGYFKGFRLQSEYLMSSVTRFDDMGTEKFNGFYIFGSMMLFGGNYQYNTSEGEFTQPKRGKSWGDIELALRYDYLNLNSLTEGSSLMGGAGEGYTLGLNYYVNNNIKIMLNYAYLNHDRYANGKNKLFVGYDANGELTKNPKLVVDETGKAGEDFHMITVRFEVDF
jgi:phosphate-selective porin OprO/OprP